MILLSSKDITIYPKLWKFTPYNYNNLIKFRFGDINNIMQTQDKQKLYLLITREKAISKLNLNYWNYKYSEEFYLFMKEKEAISFFDLEYWNYRINYGINKKLFNNNFGKSFYNSVVLSQHSEFFTEKLKNFFSKNLLKFSKERRTLIVKKFKE